MRKTPLRRLAALVLGLPPDAMVWHQDFLPPVEERLVQLLERSDAWFHALFDAQVGARSIKVPGDMTIPRPGQSAPAVADRVERDPTVIARWFAENK